MTIPSNVYRGAIVINILLMVFNALRHDAAAFTLNVVSLTACGVGLSMRDA